ncbi:hypothetical protein EAO73_31995 [Streptomyces sp. col6]|uniref:ABC transporter permease n=1 Tax=Streptomyces sp. col6 TaxID=2478958 RepID=UPI0011CDF2CF|nr:ABC transporter permease [Streptomyces sp. col6]TXR96168.1 hypothetical protein EAO73_31995 [Streptomyces sp. col6]
MSSLALREFSFWMIHYRRTWRGSAVVSFANPLLFLLAVGAGLGRLVGDAGQEQLGGVSYLAFFAPGLLAATTMQTAFIDSTRSVLTAGRPSGSYRAATAGPLEPGDVFRGHLLFITVRILLTVCAFVAVLALFDDLRGPQLFALVPAALLTGVAFAAPIAAWSATLDSPKAQMSLFRFVLLPLYMFSGTFFALDQLPRFLRVVIEAAPLWHGVELCRAISLGRAGTAGTAAHCAYLAALALAGVLWGGHTYRRNLHE